MQEEQVKHKAHGFVAKTSWWDNIKHFSFHSFFGRFPQARLITLIGILLVILVLPVTVIVLQQRTQTQQHAYMPGDGGSGGKPCTIGPVPGTSKFCCGVSYCQAYYKNTACDVITRTVQSNVTACGYSSKPKYSCVVNHLSKTPSKDASYPNDIYENSNGQTAYCGNNQYCSDNGAWQTSTGGVCHNLTPSSCTCASDNNPFNSNFTCNGGFVKRSCGGGLMCSNEHKGAQSGLWPCVPATKVTPNPNFSQYVVHCGITTNPGTCYYYEVKKLELGCDPNAYTSDRTAACGQGTEADGYSALPSCNTVVKSVTGKSGSQNLSSYNSTCVKGVIDGSGDQITKGICCSDYLSPVTVTPPPAATCTSSVGACEKYQCGAGEKVAKSSSGSTYSCAQGPEFVCCAKAPVSSPPKYYCSPNNSSDPTGTSIKGDDGSVTNCNTGTYCRNGATYSTMKGWTDAKTHLCIRTPDVCSSKYHGLCAPSCQSGDINVTDAAAVKDCADNSKGNPLCCAPKSSGGGGGGSCSNGKSTSFATEMKLPGIGSGTFENHSPKHTTRQTTVTVKDTGGKTVWTQSAFSTKLSFTSAKKLRVGTIGLGTGLACNNTYTVYVKVPGYVTMKKQITYGSTSQTLNVSESEIIPGDLVSEGTNNVVTPDGKLAGDDKVTLADYNVVRTCHNVDPNTTLSFKNGTQTLNLKCGDLMNLFDYPDGGTKGDEWAFNYNLWLRGYLKYQGL